MASEQRKQVEKILDIVRKQGWRIELGGKHWTVYPPDKTKSMVTISQTPSDGRAISNIKSDLRRNGAII